MRGGGYGPAAKTTTRYYGWDWRDLDGPEHAAFAEEWTRDGEGRLVSRRRIPLAKRGVTVSTDPRAGAIMREEMGSVAGRPMSGPHR